MAAPGSSAAHSAFLPRRILVFRALQVGDMLCAVPALRALRQTFPDAQIALAGLPWAASFAQRFARYIDDFIPFPGHPLLPEQPADLRRFEAFVDEVRSRQTDLALQMHGSGEVSNTILARLSARRCIGFGQAQSSDGFSTLPYPAYGHEIDRLLALVRFAAGLLAPATDRTAAELRSELEFPINTDDISELKGCRLHLRQHRYLCLHPGARDRRKCWPAKYFARAAEQLSADTGLPIVLTGSSAERDLTEEISAAMHRPVINAACDLSLGALAALLNDACLLISNDTAVSHMAAALRVPSVVIFRHSDIGRWAPLDHQLHRSVHDSREVSAEAVIAAARTMLGFRSTFIQ